MALSFCKSVTYNICAILAKDVPGLLHEWVSVAAASEDSGFKAAGTVGDFAGGNLGEEDPAVFSNWSAVNIPQEINCHEDKTY